MEVKEKNLLVFRLHIHAQNQLFSLQDVALSESNMLLDFACYLTRRKIPSFKGA